MDLWQLPRSIEVGGISYPIHCDFRDILEIFAYFQDTKTPEFIRWQIGLGLFYDAPIPHAHRAEAMEKMAQFLQAGQEGKPGPKLLDWQRDAPLIVADVNKAANQEIRALPFVHWWTFLSWFHAIGEGQLSTVVSIRDKLRRGKPLDQTDKDFYHQNKSLVDMPKTYTPQEEEERSRLNALLAK